MQASLFNENVDVYRRVSGARDSLNNPVYGVPITGAGWNLIYSAMPSKLAFTDKRIEFAHGGERVKPYGTLYFSADFALIQEDRVITPDNIQYVVTSIRVAYKTATAIDHYEAILELP
jgi:hypothetical protein